MMIPYFILNFDTIINQLKFKKKLKMQQEARHHGVQQP